MLSHRSKVANLRFTMNALRAPLSASPACVTMWPSRRRNACADERSLLTYRLVQRLGADQYLGTKNYGFRPGDNRSEEFVIASCSRLVPVKRVHLLAKALATITDKKIHWVHIGDGEEHDNIESIVKLFPKNIRVSFAGNIPHDAVMEYYRDHEINAFVNVSESEGLPVSIMEVISFGIPVIATDVGGTGEVVNNEMGYLLPNDFSAENLVEEINELIAMEPTQYIQLRNRIRKFWEDNFSAERNYTKYYKEITDGQR